MHRVVSTSTSVAIIALFAVLVAAYAIIRSNELSFPNNNEMAAPQRILAKDDALAAGGCKARAFEGTAKLSAWKIMKNDKAMIQVAAEDVSKLPLTDTDSFELIDTTPEIEKELADSSEDHPIEIDISGFATKCNGAALASLTYEDGIFKPYLNN